MNNASAFKYVESQRTPAKARYAEDCLTALLLMRPMPAKPIGLSFNEADTIREQLKSRFIA